MALRKTKERRPDELSSVRESVSNARACSVGLRDCQTCSGENTAVIHSTAVCIVCQVRGFLWQKKDFFGGLYSCSKTIMGDFCPVTGVSRETLPGEYQGEKSRVEDMLVVLLNGLSLYAKGEP